MWVSRALALSVALLSVCGFATSVSAQQPLFDMPMQLVPGGGEPNGPAYDFWMGRFEVTVAQYLAFLNDAEANPGNERGAYMVFDPNNGDVGLPDGNWPDDIFDIHDCNTLWVYAPHYIITYDANLPAGTRYTYDPNIAQHPIVGVSWIGAVKFCNWLTIDHGLGIDQRCYTEGNTFWDWYPVTISAANWLTRDLNATERQALVANYVGYRLPMDNMGLQSGYVSGQPNPYNEFYKAMAYSPNAPNTTRTGAYGESIPPYHWYYAYGSDVIDPTRSNFLVYDANYPDGVDPRCARTTLPVGSFADSDNNFYQIEDLCGNAYEWGQDYSDSITKVRHATWTKYYDGATPAASQRHYRVIDNNSYFSGVRVVQCGSRHLSIEYVNGSLGRVQVEPNSNTFAPGALVTLLAVPNPNRRFSQWQGDVPVGHDLDNPLTLVMDQDRVVTAVFACGTGEAMAALPLLLVALLIGPIRRSRRACRPSCRATE